MAPKSVLAAKAVMAEWKSKSMAAAKAEAVAKATMASWRAKTAAAKKRGNEAATRAKVRARPAARDGPPFALPAAARPLGGRRRDREAEEAELADEEDNGEEEQAEESDLDDDAEVDPDEWPARKAPSTKPEGKAPAADKAAGTALGLAPPAAGALLPAQGVQPQLRPPSPRLVPCLEDETLGGRLRAAVKASEEAGQG